MSNKAKTLKLNFQPTIGISSILISCIAMAIYYFTLAPTFSWGDSSDFAERLAVGDTIWDGTSRDYDLYDFVLSLFRNLPIGTMEVRANLVSAIFGAIVVGLTAYLAGIVSSSCRVSILAGGVLLAAHTFWLLSVIAEVYTFNLLIILLLYINVEKFRKVQRDKYLLLTGLFTGLSLSHHSTGLIALFSQIPLLYGLAKKSKLKHLSFWFTSVLISSFVYLQGVLTKLNSGEGLLRSLGVYRSTNYLNQTNTIEEVFKFLAFIIYNFPSLVLLLLSTLALKRVFNLKAKTNLPSLEFAFFSIVIALGGIWSTIPDKHNIYILSYPFLAVIIAVFVNARLGVLNTSRFKYLSVVAVVIAINPIVYNLSYRVADFLEINVSGARALTERSNNKYFLWPPKHDDYGPRVLTDRILKDLPENSILIADYTIFMPLRYQQIVEKKRRDVSIVFSESLLKDGLYKFIIENQKTRVFLAADKPASYYGLDIINGLLTITPKNSVFEVNLSN